MMPNEKFVTVGWQCDDAAKDATACKRIFVPTLGTVTRILRPSFPPFPPCTCFLWKLFRTSAQPIAPRCCVCRVKSLIAVSRRKCVIQLAYLHPSIFMRFRIHSSARSIEYILYSSPASCANSILHYSRPLFSFLSFDSNSRYRLKKTNKRRILSIYSEFQNSVLSAGILKSSFLVTLKQFGKILAIHPSVINRCREKVP